jgi:hypothetical protein
MGEHGARAGAFINKLILPAWSTICKYYDKAQSDMLYQSHKMLEIKKKEEKRK